MEGIEWSRDKKMKNGFAMMRGSDEPLAVCLRLII
jgi:hypothetical protein